MATGAVYLDSIHSGLSGFSMMEPDQQLSLRNCITPFTLPETFWESQEEDFFELLKPASLLDDLPLNELDDDGFYDAHLFADSGLMSMVTGFGSLYESSTAGYPSHHVLPASSSPHPAATAADAEVDYAPPFVPLLHLESNDRFGAPSPQRTDAIYTNIPTVVQDSLSEDDDDDNDAVEGFVEGDALRHGSAKSKTNKSKKSKYDKFPRDLFLVSRQTTTPRRFRRRKDQLWYFLLETLGNPMYNPQYIQWENKDLGIFRFIESKKVAQLWGEKKNRRNMSYEYFARAMRHYYARGIMHRVAGRRLVYQFGPRAENWKGYAQQVALGSFRESIGSSSSCSSSSSCGGDRCCSPSD